MTQQGFDDYLFAVFVHGKSIACIDDFNLLNSIADFICAQQALYVKGEDSFFRNVSSGQSSYPRKGFCSAAIKHLLKYHAYDSKEKEAWALLQGNGNAKSVSRELATLFKVDNEGRDAIPRQGSDWGRTISVRWCCGILATDVA